MTEYINQACPLCGSPARYYVVDGNNVKYFRCGSCKDFQISRSAEKQMAKQPHLQARRPKYAATAQQAQPGELFVIKMASGAKRDSDLLDARFVPKSELVLS